MLEEELQTKLSFRQWEKIPLKIGDAFLCMHIFMCCFINSVSEANQPHATEWSEVCFGKRRKLY